MHKPTKDFWLIAVSHLPPENQHAARQALAEKRLSPELLEAALRMMQSEAAPAQATQESNAKTEAHLHAIHESVSKLEKQMEDSKEATTGAPSTKDGVLNALGEKVQGVRNDLRKIEDKIDSLRPYSVKKIGACILVAILVGCTCGWYARIEYKQWEWENRQEAR